MEKTKSAEAQMLIRQPAREVFEAFIDPEITKHFWFTKGSGKLEVGKKITWEWEMYGFSTPVVATEIIQDKKISVEWGDPATKVDFNFASMDDGASTYVYIVNYGFNKTGDELVQAIKDSTGGFTTVVDGLKAWLEHGIELGLVKDKFPRGK
jgi:uncharacterized protein YndB with AHSA1/START domain